MPTNQKKYGIEEGNKLVQKNEKAHFWEITWMRKSDFVFGGNNRRMEGLRDFIGKLNLLFDMNGNLIGLTHGFHDTSRVHTITNEEAEKIVKDFSQKYLKYVILASLQLMELPSMDRDKALLDFEKDKPEPGKPPRMRIDYTFNARYFDNISRSDKNISISVTGDKISVVKLLDYSTDIKQLEQNDDIHNFINILIIIATIILIIVLLFKRFRAFEVGVKQGLKIAIIVALFMVIEMLISLSGELSLTYVIAMVLGPLFSGIGVLIVWSVAESLGREKWKDKFISTDLILKGYFKNSKIGNSLIKGLALGFALNAILMIIYFLSSKIFPVLIIEFSNDILTNSAGGLYLFFRSVTATCFLFFTYVLFTTSYFKGKIKIFT